jgi:protein SCO1/2
MRTLWARAGAALACVVALLCVPSATRAQLISDQPPPEIRGLEITTKLGSRLPLDLKFTDSSGKQVKLDSLFRKGRPVVMAMVYFRCPLLCPRVREEIISALNKLDFTVGTEFDVVIASFDSRDGPRDADRAKIDTLMLYERVTSEPVRKGWTFLTGEAENDRALADALGFPYRFLPESGEFSHGTALFVLTGEGVISRCYPMLPYEPKDVRLALVEAAGGKIGTLLDRLTLWCYHSTAEGKFLISPMRVMQIGAVLSAAVVLIFVGVTAGRDAMRRRSWRSPVAEAAGGTSAGEGAPAPGTPGEIRPGALGGGVGLEKAMGQAR